MLTFFDDLRYGLRTLKKQPGLTAIAVLTFTLGIGLTASMYCIVHGALRELPFEASEDLMHLERSNLSQGIESMEVTFHEFVDWRERQTSFEDLAAYYEGTANLASPGQPPERYDGAFISAVAFDLLRQEAAMGRTLAPDEEGPAAPDVVVLGWHVWQNRFAGDPGIVGRTVQINSRPTEIVGVMPEGFRFPFRQDLWLPLTLDTADFERGEGMTLEIFGRLKQGVTLDRAAQELAVIAGQLAEEYPETNEGVGSIVKPYTEEYVSRPVRAVLYTMLGGVFGVLLIACVNVANLLLARTVQRSREVAVRSALGASRWRVVSQLLTETLVLASVGAVLGLGLTYWGMEVFARVIESSSTPPYWIDFRLDPRVLAFTIGIAMLAALVSGLVPALQATGERVGEVLKDESRGSSGFRMGRFSKALVMAEVALTCGLLVGAGLMIQTIVNLRAIDWGFPTEEVFTARIGLFEEDYPEPEDRRRFFEQLQTRLEGLPGIEAASFTRSLPGLGASWARFEVEGETYERPEDRPVAHHVVVTPGFFESFGVAPLHGRTFGSEDREGGRPVVVINAELAEQLFPEESPLGRRIRLAEGEDDQPWRTVIGIVPGMYMDGADNEDPEGFYTPLPQSDARFLSLAAIPAAGDPLELASTVRREVQALDPNLPIYWVETLASSIRRQGTWYYDVFGTLFTILGFAALFLAVVGLYGVMSFSVSRRVPEVGIRMALGAKARDVVRLILRQGAIQVAVGLGLGLVLALGFSRLLSFILFEVEPWDPATFAVIAAVLALAGLTACWIPARRASRVDPMVALRGA